MNHPPKRCGTSSRIGLALLLIVCVMPWSVRSQETELRGVWLTPRSGSGFWSKAEIARAMDSLARNNFNAVYFNAWSRGWPLWRSDLFFAETGYYTDPLAGDRDILQEAIAEAHRVGLEIEAWMEYGFVAWWTGNPLAGFPKGPILARHPAWHARTSGGSDAFASGSSGTFYWMSHNNPEVQRFLAQLHTEIARKYDIDGIELDRVRYPALDCGYDSVSVKLYRDATGANPPADPSEAAWMRWRADQLNAYHRLVYDSIKAVNRNVHVSNAPGHYGSSDAYPAYATYLQDWRAWLKNRSVDGVQIQMYVTPSLLQVYIPSALNTLATAERERCYAGIAPKTSGFTLDAAQAVQLVEVVRAAGLRGHVFWYYNDLRDLGYLSLMRSRLYQNRALVPWRSAGWRGEGRILDEGATIRSTGWNPLTIGAGSGISAWERTLMFTDASTGRWMEYRMQIPASGTYEVYAHIPSGLLNLASKALYELKGSDGSVRAVEVDQSQASHAGWHKLADLPLEAGGDRVVVRLTSTGEPGKSIVGDAVMLILNRRLSPDALLAVQEAGVPVPGSHPALGNYPNPFNGSTRVVAENPVRGQMRVDLFDTLGRHMVTLMDGEREAGRHVVEWHAGAFPSGVYVARLETQRGTVGRKLLFVK